LARRPLTGLLYQPLMIDDDVCIRVGHKAGPCTATFNDIDDDECGAVGGMRIDRGNGSTRRKPTTVTLCPPQIPHDLTWARTRADAVGSRRLTA
jgi:hypothetical protein